MEKSLELVQFMQFDCDGNLYVFKPGCGCSGMPRKVSQGCTQEEMMSVFDSPTEHKLTKFPILSKEQVYKLTPEVGASANIAMKSRRYRNFMYFFIFV